MIHANLSIAFRNLRKHPFFATLNVFGLAVGMAACLTVILLIRDQLGYDKFHPAADRVFRINCQDGGTRLASTPFPLGEELLKNYAVAENTTRLERGIWGDDATTASGKTLEVRGFFAEPSFFQLFGFRLESGSEATALSEPNTVVLSKKMAERLFKNENPIGQYLNIKEKGVWQITGVMAEPSGRSHLKFDVLASIKTLVALETEKPDPNPEERVVDNWNNRYVSYNYVLLKPGQTRRDLENALASITEKRAKAGEKESKVAYFAQNLDHITPKPEDLANEMGGGAPMFFIWGMAVFVLLLTVFPCLNYSSLAVSRAIARTREMGVRKAIGASPADVRRLFLAEAVVTSMLALGLAWALHLPLNAFVKNYFPGDGKTADLTAGPVDWLLFIGLALAVGLFSGWIPAGRMARIQASTALRGTRAGDVAASRRPGWRSALLAGQFAISLVALMVVATLWSQVRYMTLASYGFQKENLVALPLLGNDAQKMKDELERDAHVVGVASTSVVLASNNLNGFDVRRKPGGEPEPLHSAAVDENFRKVMRLELIAGRDFEKTGGKGRDEQLILNERAVAHFGFKSPVEAVGQTLWVADTAPARICGVIRDFHYRQFTDPIEPFALRLSSGEGWVLQVRVASGDPVATMASLQSIWKKMDAVHDFPGVFMEESIQQGMSEVKFVGGLTSFFALLSVMLACMGLLGMVTFSVATRVKEIGVRKVLGASAVQVAVQISLRFLAILGVAMAVALPLGWLAARKFLTLFAYQVPVGALVVGGSVAVLLLLAMLAVGVQAGRAALANPVESLRSE